MFNGFSVVIANYNSGDFLEDALQSLIFQNYPNLELIVIDGGSTDNSVKIIKAYESKIAYWHSKRDNGQSDAFNQGFAKATKEWLFWLNADDFLVKNSLFRLNEKIQKHPGFDWYVFDECLVDRNGICLRVSYFPQWNNFFMQKLGPMAPCATNVFRKSLFEKSRGFDEKLHFAMDLDLWIQFFKLGYKYYNIHEYIYAFRINEQSKTMNDGFNIKRSQKRLEQTNYLYEKNKMAIQRVYLPYWRVLKMFLVGLQRLFFNFMYKGKDLRWWNTK